MDAAAFLDGTAQTLRNPIPLPPSLQPGDASSTRHVIGAIVFEGGTFRHDPGGTMTALVVALAFSRSQAGSGSPTRRVVVSSGDEVVVPPGTTARLVSRVAFTLRDRR
jgi:hypothetical protein